MWDYVGTAIHFSHYPVVASGQNVCFNSFMISLKFLVCSLDSDADEASGSHYLLLCGIPWGQAVDEVCGVCFTARLMSVS